MRGRRCKGTTGARLRSASHRDPLRSPPVRTTSSSDRFALAHTTTPAGDASRKNDESSDGLDDKDRAAALAAKQAMGQSSITAAMSSRPAIAGLSSPAGRLRFDAATSNSEFPPRARQSAACRIAAPFASSGNPTASRSRQRAVSAPAPDCCSPREDGTLARARTDCGGVCSRSGQAAKAIVR
jgi:hypothetical protein